MQERLWRLTSSETDGILLWSMSLSDKDIMGVVILVLGVVLAALGEVLDGEVNGKAADVELHVDFSVEVLSIDTVLLAGCKVGTTDD